MTRTRALSLACCCIAAAAAGALPGCKPEPAASPAASPTAPLRAPDVAYDPTPEQVVLQMLELAEVRPSDVVYDLGCGDGRIVVAAAKDHGARGVCIDIDPERIRESRERASSAGVIDRITFLNQDLFDADVAAATVVMLFLSAEVNMRVRPKLLRELKPGTRVVSYWHDMGNWKPDRVITARIHVYGESQPIYLWRIPG